MTKTQFFKSLAISTALCSLASVLSHYFPKETFSIAWAAGAIAGLIYVTLKD